MQIRSVLRLTTAPAAMAAALTLSMACAEAAPVDSPSPTPRHSVDRQTRAVGLVDVKSVVADAVLDLRYATTDNFVGERLYPPDARCLVHESMAPGLRTAAQKLRAGGQTLVFWDCYRPHSVQQKMFQKVPDPAWVAAPGPYSTSHETGRSVDVTLAVRSPGCTAPRKIGNLCRVDMGTDFDSFTPRANAYATQGVSAPAQAARARLRQAMADGGLTVYSGEWWHFDGPGADVRRPIVDVPLV
ncbi:D-alanyl-D-alanine dipeptidase [Gordonia alkanivorans]|uniref:M15 family metallopeptidase n=1 Tax=Gordonia alkanivorans TaxID=84096 RepID=UPI000FDD7932|nr:M15 family metallopeptidase [Gordonia alkanivorans]AZZ80190.1 D-alanyl-D-alanine dipeptidase [Gordonia alkanivorans]